MSVMGYSNQMFTNTGLTGQAGALKTQIQGLTRHVGKPDTGLALRQMIDLMNTQGRPNVPKVNPFLI